MDVVVASDRVKTSEVEWQARCDLAALYRVCDHLGWTDLIDTHMSVRVPGEPTCFLINHYEETFDEITASRLIKMDLDGRIYGKEGRFNAAGFTIHSGVYKARPDANCVMHTHTRAGGGVSLLKKGLRPISQDVMHVYDDLVYHAYGTPATVDECEALGETCRKGSHVILRNHGLLTAAPTLPGALRGMYMLERACELELIARQLDEEPVMIDDYIVKRFAQRMKELRASPDYGVAYFEALKRQVERQIERTGGTDWRQ